MSPEAQALYEELIALLEKLGDSHRVFTNAGEKEFNNILDKYKQETKEELHQLIETKQISLSKS